MDNRHIREEILKYWHVIEFLNQNEFPTIKNKKSIGGIFIRPIGLFYLLIIKNPFQKVNGSLKS